MEGETGVVTALLDKVERLEAIIAARLCPRHATTDGLYGYEPGDGVTAQGGGCVVCIGERVAAKLEELRSCGVCGKPVDRWMCRDCENELMDCNARLENTFEYPSWG